MTDKDISVISGRLATPKRRSWSIFRGENDGDTLEAKYQLPSAVAAFVGRILDVLTGGTQGSRAKIFLS